MHISIARSRIFIALASATAAGALAACGGGGGGAHGSALPSATATPVGVSQPASSARLTVTFKRQIARKKVASANARKASATHHAPAISRVASTSKRSPKYISPDAAGLQVAVSAPGGATTTVYADISPSSPLCTLDENDNVTTCTIPLTNASAGYSIVATEVDTAPSGENTTTGLGSGLDVGSFILADGATTIAAGTTPGTVSIVPLALGPVAGVDEFYDCGATSATATINAGDVQSNGNDQPARIVVTQGVASTLQVQPQTADSDGNYFLGTAGQSFENVLATPTPITAVSSSASVTLASVTDPAVSVTAASGFGTTASFADSGAQTNINALDNRGCFTMLLDVKYDGSVIDPSTITLNTNDNAMNPFFPGSYIDSPTMYTVVPISASPTSFALNLGDNATATFSDYGEQNDSIATPCNDANGNTLASVVSNGDYNSTTGLETFAVTANVVGTCTFVFADGDTGLMSNTGVAEPAVQTTPVTVTIGAGGTSPVTITGRHRAH
jgi:hypothetical protein